MLQNPINPSHMTRDVTGRRQDRHVAAIAKLGLPIVIGQIGAILQQFADTMMVGQYGTPELSASGFVNGIMSLVVYFLLGISYSTTPAVGGYFGSKDLRSVARTLKESLAVNISFSIITCVAMMLLSIRLDIMHQPEELLPLIRPYFLILTASLPFLAAFNSLKQFCDGVGETKSPMWIMIASNIINVVLNWVMIFGHLGCPELGLAGAGLATLISRVFMLAALAAYVMFSGRFRHLVHVEGSNATWTGARHLTLKGLPISLQLCMEAASFNVGAIFMGWLGAIPLAAHQVMSSIATLSFQVMYGIAAAASVRISQFRDRSSHGEIRRIAYSGLGLAACASAVVVLLTCIFRYPLVGAFTTSPEVVDLTMSLLVLFAIYQFGDCLQITFANCLRGLEVVEPMMKIAFVAYILVSLPLSYLFAFTLDLGPVGVWMGIPFGLTTAGVLFLRTFLAHTR